MRTLILDTSGPFTTVLVAVDGVAVASATSRLPALRHLHPTIREVVARLGIGLADVDRLAVVVGPGSWTGLNIGVTAAKTLAQVLELPLVELVSLDVLVGAERWTEGPVYGILDAKRGNVYCATYSTDPLGMAQLEESEPDLMAFDDLRDRLAGSEGRPLVVEYGDVYRARVGELPRVVCLSRARLSAAGLVAALGAAMDRALDAAGILELSPLYLQSALGGS